MSRTYLGLHPNILARSAIDISSTGIVPHLSIRFTLLAGTASTSDLNACRTLHLATDLQGAIPNTQGFDCYSALVLAADQHSNSLI